MKNNVKNILDLSPEEKRKFLDSFDFIISDCDSVLWYVFEPMPGVAESISLLKSAEKKFAFMSNNSVRPWESYKTLFDALKCEIDRKDVIHPALSIIFKDILIDAGFTVIDGPQDSLPESFRQFLEIITDKEPVKAVVIDTDLNCSYAKLARAQLYLQKDPDCKLIIGASDCLLPVSKRFHVIGPGYMSEILAKSSKQKPIMLGKPGQDLADLILKQYDIQEPKRVLFIGDMIEQDIGFGAKCGFQKMLVLTGGSSFEDMENHKIAEEVPDYYAKSFADFIDFFKDI